MLRPWTPDEIAQLRQLAKDGKLAKSIGATLHRAESTIRRKAEELKIEIRRSSIRMRPPNVPTHAERTAIIALHQNHPLPIGAGQATLEGLVQKRWIEMSSGAWRATPDGLEAMLRKITQQQ